MRSGILAIGIDGDFSAPGPRGKPGRTIARVARLRSGPPPASEPRGTTLAVRALLGIGLLRGLLRAAGLTSLLAWVGMVSCDDPDRIAASVRGAVNDSDAFVRCQEPRAWHGETDWVCTVDLRGERGCFVLRDRDDPPRRIPCPKSGRKAAVELP